MEHILSLIDNATIHKVIERYGKTHQVDMLQEECMELALAIRKMYRAIGTPKFQERQDAVIDELADVIIMTNQAINLFHYQKIAARVAYKMARLSKRLEDAERREKQLEGQK